jgi:predicted metal-dependent peptidase
MLQKTETHAFRAITRARSRLILSNAFFGTLASGLELIETDAIPTMATDGTRLLYNPEFTLGLTDQELIGVLVHEVCHCADRHHTRRSDRDPLIWNVAADFRVNFDVRDCGYHLPWRGCTLRDFLARTGQPGEHRHFYDPQFSAMGVEEIYRIVHEAIEQERDRTQPQGQPNGGKPGQNQTGSGLAPDNGTDTEEGAGNAPGEPQGTPQDAANDEGGAKVAGDDQTAPAPARAPANGNSTGEGSAPINAPDPGGCGGILDAAPAHDPVGRAEAERDWQTRLRQAAAIARTQAGTLPGFIKRIIDELNNPVIDWRVELRRFTDLSSHKDYTWARPSRRHLWRGLILPGLRPDRPAHVVLIIDSSGSVYDGRPQEKFCGEMQTILNDGACDKVTAIYADTRVASEPVTFEAGDLIKLEVKGGGGTAFREPLQWVTDNIPDAAAIIYFTDAETSDWGDEPASCPVLWCVYGDEARARRAAAAAPFGETLFVGD